MKKRLVSICLVAIFILACLSNLDASPVKGFEPIEYSGKLAFWAFILGGLTAISLVIGALLGIVWKPKPKITAAFTAFGAGALLAALSVELIAPTVMEFVHQAKSIEAGGQNPNSYTAFMALIGGSILGGLVFFSFDEALNNQGGYLRKLSTTIAYFNRYRRNRYRIIIKRLSKIKLFRTIPPENMDLLIRHIRQITFHQGQIIFRKGEISHRTLIIEQGEVVILNNSNGQHKFTAGDIIGENSLLSHEPMSVTMVAKTDVKAFGITQPDFKLICDSSESLRLLIENEAHHELMASITVANHSETNDSEEARHWSKEANAHLHHSNHIPTNVEINEAAKKYNSAPLSIWLGNFLDGIPESFVIGAGFMMIVIEKSSAGTPTFTEVIPYTLIAGLFISNIPEAMSSSLGMRSMGWSIFKILTLWVSLMLMTAVGSALGYYYGKIVPGYVEIGLEGMAAGAMLTMVAQTMIPEAVHIGGNRISGLSTLAGYLSAIAFKIFEK